MVVTIRNGMDETRHGGDRRVSCIVADDHPALVEAVASLLHANGIDVVAKVRDGEEALAAIRAHEPTVAVLDLIMPRRAGIEVARLTSQMMPRTETILYTGQNDRELLVEALDAGARGFVLKEAPLLELVRAVQLVANGGTYVDPVLAPTLVRGGSSQPHPALSTREREILRLLADGKSNDEIARALFISPETVRTYIRRAMQKLEADTRTQAVAIAMRSSYIS
jgi:DNA-binding NarL/FixJ family response regulator